MDQLMNVDWISKSHPLIAWYLKEFKTDYDVCKDPFDGDPVLKFYSNRLNEPDFRVYLVRVNNKSINPSGSYWIISSKYPTVEGCNDADIAELIFLISIKSSEIDKFLSKLKVQNDILSSYSLSSIHKYLYNFLKSSTELKYRVSDKYPYRINIYSEPNSVQPLFYLDGSKTSTNWSICIQGNALTEIKGIDEKKLVVLLDVYNPIDAVNNGCDLYKWITETLALSHFMPPGYKFNSRLLNSTLLICDKVY